MKRYTFISFGPQNYPQLIETEDGEYVKLKDVEDHFKFNAYICPMCKGEKEKWKLSLGNQSHPLTCSLCNGKGFVIDK